MGDRGPKPKPNVIKLAEGNELRGRDLVGLTPEPEFAVPPKPEDLSTEAAKEWDRIVPILFELGLLSDLDQQALVQYCFWHGEFVEAARLIKKGRIIKVETKNGTYLRVNPAFSILESASRNIQKAIADFGLSPSARSRIIINGKPNKPEDESKLEKLFD